MKVSSRGVEHKKLLLLRTLARLPQCVGDFQYTEIWCPDNVVVPADERDRGVSISRFSTSSFEEVLDLIERHALQHDLEYQDLLVLCCGMDLENVIIAKTAGYSIRSLAEGADLLTQRFSTPPQTSPGKTSDHRS